MALFGLDRSLLASEGPHGLTVVVLQVVRMQRGPEKWLEELQ